MNINFWTFIKEIYNAWDSIVGKILNIIAVLSGFAPIFIWLKIIPIEDEKFKIIFSLVFAVFPIIAILISNFNVWKHLKLELYNEKHKNIYTCFDLDIKLYSLRLGKYKEFILKKITHYKNLMEQAPDSLDYPFNITRGILNDDKMYKDDYNNWINQLEKYLLQLDKFINSNMNLYLFEVTINSDRTDKNIDVNLSITGKSYFLEADNLKFPKYPIIKRGFMSIINPLPIRIEPQPHYRTRIEVSSQALSCNLRDIKKDQPVLFMNEIFIMLQDENSSVSITINSDNSGGAKNQILALDNSKVYNSLELSDLEGFEYIAGKYED